MLKCLVSRGGILFKNDAIDVEVLQKIKKRLTPKHVGFQNAVTSIQTYKSIRKQKVTEVCHIKGRTVLEKAGYQLQITSLIRPGIPLDKKNAIPVGLVMYDYQDEIIRWLNANKFTLERCQIGMGSAIIELRAGLGKTWVAMGLIASLGVKTLFIVPNKILIVQAAKDLQIYFPNLQIGFQYGDLKTDGDIVVACASSMMVDEFKFKESKKWKTLRYDEWFERFGLTIIDEVHTLCTTKKVKIFQRARSYFTLGMSATCHDRLDKMDIVAHNYLGIPVKMDEVIESLGEDPTKDLKLHVTRLKYNGPDEFTKTLVSRATAHGGGTVSHPLMVNQITLDPNRFNLILREVKKLYDMGHVIFVFVDRRDLVSAIVIALRKKYGNLVDAPEMTVSEELNKMTKTVKKNSKSAYEMLPEEKKKISGIMGGTVDAERLMAKSKSRICVITYPSGGTGLSFSRYTAAIFAHPRRNGFKQINNRIFRMGAESKRTRDIIYIVDNKTTLKGQYSGFKSTCKEERPDTVFKDEVAEWQDLENYTL
jgi:hypothetical protein